MSIASVMSFLALLVSPAAARADDAKPLPTTIALPATSLTFSTTYLAHDLGLWDKDGLAVKLVDIQGVGSPNAVIAGSVDFTLTTGSTFARAAERGRRMLVIANMLDRPMMELVLRKDLADAGGYDPQAPVAERARILRGKTIGVDGIYTNLHALLQLVAKKAGLDPDKDVRVTPMPAPNMPAAMAAKAIDGFSSSLPWTIGAVAAGKAVMLASGPRGDLPELLPFAYSVVMTRPETCRERRPLCAKLVDGFVAAAKLIREQPDAAFAVLQKRFPQMDAQVLKESIAIVAAATPQPPAVTAAQLENSERFNVAAGVVKPEQEVKTFAGLYSNEFVR